jgi:hypothetical protein
MTSLPAFNVVLVHPDTHQHASAFSEIAEITLHGLREAGYPATLRRNEIHPNARNIVVGGHLLSAEECRMLPADTVIFNTEQMFEGSRFLTPTYRSLMSTFEVWDYSAMNIRFFRDVLPASREVRHVPLGYATDLSRIKKRDARDIDVLFYGSLNARRATCLQNIAARGLKVEHLYGVYGAERDAYVARAKIVLNLHYHDTPIIESARIAYLLANGTAVVSEDVTNADDRATYADSVLFADYSLLAEACHRLIQGDAWKDLEADSLARFQKRRAAGYLRAALDDSAPPLPEKARQTGPGAVPRRINFGSGRDFRDDLLNIDVDAKWAPDICADLSAEGALGRQYATERFGEVTLAENAFDEIFCLDVLEHVPRLVPLMTTFLGLLRQGGTLKVVVPYDLSLGAWQDPTHVRSFNENSWKYYTEWFWYLGWSEHRFQLSKLEFQLSQQGQALRAQGGTVPTLLHTPRAVDSMYAELTKVLLSPEETATARRESARAPRASRDRYYASGTAANPPSEIVWGLSDVSAHRTDLGV